MKIISYSLLLLVTWSCFQKTESPESFLESYVEYRFKEKQDRQEILRRITGPLFAEINQMSNEEFEILIKTYMLELNKFEITSKKCSEKTCYLTYSLSYHSLKQPNSSKKKTFTSIKKIAELRQEEKEWKIHDVRNIKTIHDSNDSILIRSIR